MKHVKWSAQCWADKFCTVPISQVCVSYGAHVEEAEVLTVLTAPPERGPVGVSYGAHSPSWARPCGVLWSTYVVPYVVWRL